MELMLEIGESPEMVLEKIITFSAQEQSIKKNFLRSLNLDFCSLGVGHTCINLRSPSDKSASNIMNSTNP